jgi:hypothetical protein
MLLAEALASEQHKINSIAYNGRLPKKFHYHRKNSLLLAALYLFLAKILHVARPRTERKELP